MNMYSSVRMGAWLSTTIVFSAMVPTSHAQTLVDQGHAVGPQCVASGVNDSAIDVGGCVTLTGSKQAFFNAGGDDVALAPVQAGDDCFASDITDDDEVFGECSTGGLTEAVSWNTSFPTQINVLKPYSVLGLIGDVQSSISAFDEQHDVVGESVAANGYLTPVVWLAGATSATPISLAASRSNCSATDVERIANGQLEVLLNCPTSHGEQASVALGTITAGIVTFSIKDLLVPAGYNNCVGSELNTSGSLSGTCKVTAGVATAAYWTGVGSTPVLLNSLEPALVRSFGVMINDNANVAVSYQDGAGLSQAGWWNTSSNTFTPILPSSGATETVVADMARHADFVAINELDSDENVEGASWVPGLEVVTPIGFETGGKASKITSLSGQGSVLAADAMSQTGQEGTAVVVP